MEKGGKKGWKQKRKGVWGGCHYIKIGLQEQQCYFVYGYQVFVYLYAAYSNKDVCANRITNSQ